ncbi:hypothetical protein AVEN_8281-1 [Araneus ventricosus]|uniref:Uncharacterized protein n=1 Tax=Araneus ventricosus TaxID=182803 RepID=A0A4Y2FD18_ARAVE|nr:hypothetical protein AVEN_8281-1 [Araneus ventricosus]
MGQEAENETPVALRGESPQRVRKGLGKVDKSTTSKERQSIIHALLNRSRLYQQRTAFPRELLSHDMQKKKEQLCCRQPFRWDGQRTGDF